jgi:hypothetical protein
VSFHGEEIEPRRVSGCHDRIVPWSTVRVNRILSVGCVRAVAIYPARSPHALT